MNSKEVFGYTIYEDGTVLGKRGVMLSPSDNGKGYLVLGLMINGERKTKAVHKLVAIAFVDNPNNLLEVNHKDGNKENNHFTNLEWVTRGENIQHAFENRLRSAEGTNNARCQTSENTVREICELLEQGFTSAQIRDIGYDYNLSRAIKSKKNWNHISKEYSF